MTTRSGSPKKRGLRVLSASDSSDRVQAFEALPLMDDQPPPDPREAEEAGYQAGLDRGIEEGRRKGEAACDGLRRRLATSIEALAVLSRDRVRLHEKELVRLALALAARLLRRHVAEGDELVTRTLGEALAVFPAGRPVTVRVHPDDADALWLLAPRLKQESQLEVIQDRSLEPGSLVASDGATDVDARLEEQLAALARALDVEPLPEPAAETKE